MSTVRRTCAAALLLCSCRTDSTAEDAHGTEGSEAIDTTSSSPSTTTVIASGGGASATPVTTEAPGSDGSSPVGQTTQATGGAPSSSEASSSDQPLTAGTAGSNAADSAGGSSATQAAGAAGSQAATDAGGGAATGNSEGNPGGSAGGNEGEPTNQASGTLVEEDRAAIPIPRGEHGVGALDDEVYVMCGFTPSVTSSVQVYSPEQDSWRDAADFPVVCHHPNVASVNGRLYVLGFHAGSGQRMADGRVYAYDPTDNAWTPRTSQPLGTERGASCVTTYEDKIYVFGGTNDIALADASIYDPEQDSWEVLPPMPAFRHHCIAAEVNDEIYIVSGRDVVIEEVQTESYVYDPVAQTYREVAPIPTPRGGAAGGELGGRIYVFGGEGNVNDPKGIFHEAEVYDPAADSWSPLPDMQVPRHGFGAAVIGDRMYLPGGSTSQGIDAQTTHSVVFIQAP